MAITEVYVDPSIAGDSGAGTIGDPYGDLEYACENATYPGSGGIRFNVKAGTDEILAVELSAAIATGGFTPAENNPLIFQGYTAAAGDGGVGGISGGGSVSIISDTAFDYVFFVDMHLHNCGANPAITLDNYGGAIRCEIENCSVGIDADLGWTIAECYIHTCTSYCIDRTSGQHYANYIDGTSCTSDCVVFLDTNTVFYNNIVISTDGVDGIRSGNESVAINNSVYANAAGNAAGIYVSGSHVMQVVSNNIVEGFSGTNGVGFEFATANDGARLFRSNAVYNCATEYQTPGVTVRSGDNETLTASAFNSPGTGDFSPADSGNVKEGAVPQMIGGGLV